MSTSVQRVLDIFSPRLPLFPYRREHSTRRSGLKSDRRRMNWRKSTSVQSRANLRRRQQQPPPSTTFPFPPCSASPASLPSLALPLEQTLWRRRRDVSPFTAALQPALAAPLRRLPWSRGFGLVTERRFFSADQPGTEPGIWVGSSAVATFIQAVEAKKKKKGKSELLSPFQRI